MNEKMIVKLNEWIAEVYADPLNTKMQSKNMLTLDPQGLAEMFGEVYSKTFKQGLVKLFKSAGYEVDVNDCDFVSFRITPRGHCIHDWWMA